MAKKWLSLILTACMVFSLAACGGNTTNNGGSSDDGAGGKKESIVVANSFDADTFYPYNSEIMTNQVE